MQIEKPRIPYIPTPIQDPFASLRLPCFWHFKLENSRLLNCFAVIIKSWAITSAFCALQLRKMTGSLHTAQKTLWFFCFTSNWWFVTLNLSVFYCSTIKCSQNPSDSIFLINPIYLKTYHSLKCYTQLYSILSHVSFNFATSECSNNCIILSCQWLWAFELLPEMKASYQSSQWMMQLQHPLLETVSWDYSRYELSQANFLRRKKQIVADIRY